MKRIFLVGCPRSGTTLLQTLIGAHPDLVTLPETHFYSRVVARTTAGRKFGFVRPDALRAVLGLREAGLVSMSESKAFPPRSPLLDAWSRAFIGRMDDMAIARGASGWLEKTPAHLRYIDQICRLVPDVHFVHVVRNGTDVAVSLHRAIASDPRAWRGIHFWQKNDIVACCERWATDVATSAKYAGDERHVFVRYEDAADRPGEISSELFDALGLSTTPVVLAESANARAGTAREVVLEREAWKINTDAEVSRRGAGENLSAFVEGAEAEKLAISRLTRGEAAAQTLPFVGNR